MTTFTIRAEQKQLIPAALDAIRKHYTDVGVCSENDNIELTSQRYSADFLRAIWCAAIANTVAAAETDDGRNQLMDYLLS